MRLLMQKLVLMTAISFFLATTSYSADPNEAVFQSNRCGICHKPDVSKSNPSLKEIARAYQGKESQLAKYLQGESDPIVVPERAGTMKRYVEKTKSLSAPERKALADFIIGH